MQLVLTEVQWQNANSQQQISFDYFENESQAASPPSLVHLALAALLKKKQLYRCIVTHAENKSKLDADQ